MSERETPAEREARERARREARERLDEEERRDLEEEADATPDLTEPGGISAREATVEPYGEASLVARLSGLFRRQSVRKRLLAPLGADAAILVTNLITGVIVARALGPQGRGELTAVLMVAQIAAWSFSMGNTEAISYYQARHPELASRLTSSWLAVMLPLTILGIAVTELLLPILFSAQSDQAIDYAQLYLAVIPLILLQGNFSGSVLADEDFTFFNISRFVAPAFIAVSYLGLWAAGHFTVELALISNFIAMGIMVAMLGWRTLRRHPLVRPDWPLLRQTMFYGVKAHAGSIGSIVNARLDLVILPAFVSAASIGLYSVATNVSSILPVLTGTIAIMLLPVASRRQGSARTVILTMQATMAISLAFALPLMILAPILLDVVYGSGFEAATTSLRWLLPGAVAQAGVTVLWSGLLAADRPFLGSLGIAPAAVMTIVGLIVFLPKYGIEAAAIITTGVYLIELVILAVLYRHVMGLQWREYLKAPPH